MLNMTYKKKEIAFRTIWATRSSLPQLLKDLAWIFIMVVENSKFALYTDVTDKLFVVALSVSSQASIHDFSTNTPPRPFSTTKR